MNGYRLEKKQRATLFDALGGKPKAEQPVANLSKTAREYLLALKIRNADTASAASLIWLHALAIGYSPAYLSENADGIRRDWPCVPLPNSRGLTVEQAIAILGSDTRDVYLSDKAYWRNVPANVWEYFIGGYQIIKKWLSYREQELLGRACYLAVPSECEGQRATRRKAAK